MQDLVLVGVLDLVFMPVTVVRLGKRFFFNSVHVGQDLNSTGRGCIK